MKKLRRLWSLLLCCSIIMTAGTCVHATENTEQRTVRVGFFSSDGYHIMDDDGTMNGYGYDFLQMLLRYNNWKYEYEGYDNNWSDMLDMLENGQIDMVTLANKTPDRLERFDYSEKSIGTSSTIMTTGADNTKIIPGDYETYEGVRVGLVEGSAHNENFQEYASEKGFSYEPVYYDDISDLLADLKSGENIDIAVTSNMRQVQDEVILDEFNAMEYYAIVKKGNTALLEEINQGIAQLNVYSPDWRTVLFQKYYQDINSKAISFSVDERAYLKELKDDNTVIKIAMNPELRPYSYFEEGVAKGIAPVIFKEIAGRLGIQYEILSSKDRWEYKEQLASGEADIDLTAYLDYSLAQRYNLKETDAYINSTIAMLTRRDSDTDKNTMVVAALRDPTEYMGFNNDLIYPFHYKEYESTQDCIDAVKRGDADATFQYVYIAEQAATADYTNRLQYTIMPDFSFGLTIGVNDEKDHRLLSILNKGVNSLATSYTQGVMLEESTNVTHSTELISIAYEHPIFVLFVIVCAVIVLFIILLLIQTNRNQKNKLLASMEKGRFIGYVCESYETVVEVNLKENFKTTYYMAEGKLLEEKEPYIPFDRAYFQDIVPEEELQQVVEAFADTTTRRMIRQEGSEQYFECRVKDGDGDYNWYSYIIKAVPRDEKHPENYVIFKKNIQSSKQNEEQQRQILKDALESAQNASAAKGQFLSKMSHEIRTPLNAVIGYMKIARDSAENPSKVMHCVENSEIAAKHLLNIINNVLDISAIESGGMKIAHEQFDLKSQLTTISTMFFNQTKEKDVKFCVSLLDVTEEKVIGDGLRVNQILMNLLSNAMKFTPKDGTIKLSVTQVQLDEKRVFMKFMVSDTGIGMSEEYRQRLFKPFEQESATTAQKYGGSGLGLSITYNLIQMMGGSIDVISKQGEGSTFVVSLHFEKCEEQNAQEMQHDYSHVRALVVGNEKDSCDYIKALLKRCKVKSDVSMGVEKAVQQLRRRMETEFKYDLCIIDWNMSYEEMSDLISRMREVCKMEQPIFVATTYDVVEFEDEAKKIGVDKVIAKPLFQSSLFDLLVSTYGKYEPVSSGEEKSDRLKGVHVLLAEDNAMNLEIAMEILQKAGLVVDAVTDGRQAVDRFTVQPAGTYQAILMDVQMPVMDGYQATGAIRRSAHPEAATIPIIAMTANAFAEDMNNALASGMNGHISKPVDYDKLYAILEKYCAL
ncbi:MAG: transporter substrate-binding domain-containing protein [Lachnospiraceae bacterium]|nr:transporter substrate-binding domain-containing protein [Lachnospiraceae bacterium]